MEKQRSIILEFYFRFRLRPYHHSWHITLHQSTRLYPNRTAHGRKMTPCRFSTGSLKSPCTTSYMSSIETSSFFLLFLRKSRIGIWRQTDKQMNRPIALSRSRYRERRLNKRRRSRYRTAGANYWQTKSICYSRATCIFLNFCRPPTKFPTWFDVAAHFHVNPLLQRLG